MCKTADNIFDGGLSDVRGDREYQRSRGYQIPNMLPKEMYDDNFPPCPTKRPRLDWREAMSLPLPAFSRFLDAAQTE